MALSNLSISKHALRSWNPHSNLDAWRILLFYRINQRFEAMSRVWFLKDKAVSVIVLSNPFLFRLLNFRSSCWSRWIRFLRPISWTYSADRRIRGGDIPLWQADLQPNSLCFWVSINFLNDINRLHLYWPLTVLFLRFKPWLLMHFYFVSCHRRHLPHQPSRLTRCRADSHLQVLVSINCALQCHRLFPTISRYLVNLFCRTHLTRYIFSIKLPDYYLFCLVQLLIPACRRFLIEWDVLGKDNCLLWGKDLGLSLDVRDFGGRSVRW